MVLRLAPARVDFAWNGAAIADLVADAADIALASCAIDAVEIIQDRAPVDTGSLQSSVHTAPVGFARDESPIYDRRREGVFVARTLPTLAQVLAQIADGKLWVGSWIFYAYYVERGAYNKLAGRSVPGRNFIGPNAQWALVRPGRFAEYFNQAWRRIARVAA